MTVGTATGSRRERKKEERRQRLFAAAKELFRERGYDDVTVSEITARADLSKGTFFNYYESKAHVLLDYAREVSRGLIEYGGKLRGDDTQALFERFFARMDRVFRDEGTLIDVLVRELPTDLAFQEAYRRGSDALLELYRGFIERGMASGRVRADLDPALAAELVRDVWLATRRAWVASGRSFSLRARAVEGRAPRASPPPQEDPAEIPAIARFLAEGLGELHAEAPEQTEQFGQLAGLWSARQEMRGGDGSWQLIGEGYWAWKYTLEGFAVQDLWYQGADALPPYMAGLGRDYLLSATRVFDMQSLRWKVAWMSNGAGKSPGSDFGTFEAVYEDERIVMTSPPDPRFGQQRVVFAEITEDSFTWQSEYSRDEGETWQATMRMQVERLE